MPKSNANKIQLRLDPEAITIYKNYASTMGIPLGSCLRKILEDAAPGIAVADKAIQATMKKMYASTGKTAEQLKDMYFEEIGKNIPE